MTEYEIADLISSVSSNMIAGQALFLTFLSGYLVVAYSVGRSLTTYQVSFINLVFILFGAISLISQTSQFGMVFRYSDMLAQMGPVDSSTKNTREFARALVISVRVVLIVGALIFMWQVRHPKTE